MKKIDDLTDSILSKLKKQFYIGVFQDSMALLDTSINTRFSNFATNIRELTRNLLAESAPDSQVQNCSWYEEILNEDGKIVVTRVQRMTYTIKGGLSDQFIEDELKINFDEVNKKLNQALQKLNKYTHLNEKVYSYDEVKGYEMVEKTLVALDNFFESISNFRSMLINKLEALTDDVIDEIDILATHYWIEGSSLESITILDITSNEILIDGKGTVEVKHQYGSDGDFRRGDGVRIENSYPFTISLVSDIDSPLEVSIEADQIIIDNFSFYE